MLIGRTLLSRYTIASSLGSGGFGDTYLATDTALPGAPSCVVKHLRPKNTDPQLFKIAQRLFDQEARVLYQLGTTPQIPSLYAHFQEEGEFFLVQEFIDGHDLSQELAGRAWPEQEAIQLLKELLGIVAVVHQHQVIHRDIKPANIMRRRQDQRLMLIDFGAVKQLSQLTIDDAGHTQTSVMVGSPGFMPAEQSSGHPRPASDVYAVGMVGIQALTGMMPTQLPINPETLELQWRDLIPISDAVANIITTMVRYHFQDRYGDAIEALQAFTALETQGFVPATDISPLSNSSDSTNSATIGYGRPSQYPVNVSPRSNRRFFAGSLLLIVGMVAIAAIGGIGLYQLFSEAPLVSESEETQPPLPTASPIIAPSIELPTPSTEELQQQQEVAERLQQLEKDNQTLAEKQANFPASPEPTQVNLVWRSKSNYTRLHNLNQICFGNAHLTTIQTVFGYNKSPLSGQIWVDNPKMNGCQFGDVFKGNFLLSKDGYSCEGNVTINWGNNDHAYLKWNISNLGLTCPVTNEVWQINTYPEQ